MCELMVFEPGVYNAYVWSEQFRHLTHANLWGLTPVYI
jgi:hypothetical protein